MDPLAMLIVGVAFATSVISAVLGMAGGMILMGVYAITLPVQVAMILHGVTQLFANGFRAFLMRDRIYTAGLLWYALGALAAIALFSGLALVVSQPVLFLALGAIPLTLSLLPRSFAPRFESRGSASACGAPPARVTISGVTTMTRTSETTSCLTPRDPTVTGGTISRSPTTAARQSGIGTASPSGLARARRESMSSR